MLIAKINLKQIKEYTTGNLDSKTTSKAMDKLEWCVN